MGILTPEIKEFIKKIKLGFVATVCPDGTPNLSPKGTTMAWDDEHMIFADIHSPGTINNLLVNPSVEINMVDIFTRKGYRFKGTGEVLSEGPLFEEIVAFYKNAGAGYIINNIALIKIKSILPVTSPVYDTGITEEEVIIKWRVYWDAVHGKKL